MKIPLSRGLFCEISPEDAWVKQWKWCATSVKTNGPYAVRCDYSAGRANRKFLYLHKVILGCKKGEHGDHINGNTLDNRRENLRKATIAQNTQNSKKSRRNTSGFKGAIWVKDPKRPNRGRWSARIRVGPKLLFLGYFHTPKEAGEAYNKAAIEHFGEFANLNVLL